MIIDNELVLIDNKPVGEIAKSDIVKMQNAYKPMFIYAAVEGGAGTMTVDVKVSPNRDMSEAYEAVVVKVDATTGKGATKALLPIVDLKEFYVQADSTTTVSDGTAFVAIVSDVDVR